MNKDLQIGQRVRLSENHEWDVTDYGNGFGNPTDCDGTVNLIDDQGWVSVNWDNDRHNNYAPYDSDLIPIDATADSALETLV